MCSVFIELEKAFDTIDYLTLLQKPYQNGIWDLAHTWFRLYLCNQQPFIFVLGSSLKLMSIKSE